MILTRQPNVLLVEDEALVRAIISAHLRDEGFRVIEAAAAADAIALIEQHLEIDVLFTDVNMPGAIDGLDLAVEVRRSRPHIHVIMTSGRGVRASAVPAGAVFFQKPYSVVAVAQLMRDMVKAAA
jgi:CheY-like chemotaxis protein